MIIIFWLFSSNNNFREFFWHSKVDLNFRMNGYKFEYFGREVMFVDNFGEFSGLPWNVFCGLNAL